MALPFYPPELPKPTQEGYQLARGDGRIVTRNDAGPPNIRSRFSSVVDTVQFSTFLSRSQWGRLDRFYYEDTKKGTKPFLMPDPGTDGWALLTDSDVPILIRDPGNPSDGTPILLSETWLVTFGGKLPVVTNKATYWTISFEVTVLP